MLYLLQIKNKHHATQEFLRCFISKYRGCKWVLAIVGLLAVYGEKKDHLNCLDVDVDICFRLFKQKYFGQFLSVFHYFLIGAEGFRLRKLN